MNKKLIKTIVSITFGTGIISPIFLVSVSCGSSPEPTPIEDSINITYGQTDETEIEVFLRKEGISEFPLVATSKDDKQQLDVQWSINSQKTEDQVKILNSGNDRGKILYKKFTSLERYDFVVRATTVDGSLSSTKTFTIVPNEAQPAQIDLIWEGDESSRIYTSHDGKEGVIPGTFSSQISPSYASQDTIYTIRNNYDNRIFLDESSRTIKYENLTDGKYTFSLIATSSILSTISDSLDFELNIANSIPDDKIIVEDGVFEGIDPNYVGDDKVLYLPENVTSISSTAKNSIPNTIVSIDLSKCDNLSEITDNAFQNKNKIKSVIFPKNVVTITNSAFEDCSALEEVDLSGCTKLETIGNKAFGGTGIKSLKLPGCLKRFESTASFWYCRHLKEIIWDNLPSTGPKINIFHTPTFTELPDTQNNHGVFKVTNSPSYSSTNLLQWFKSQNDSTKFTYWVAG